MFFEKLKVSTNSLKIIFNQNLTPRLHSCIFFFYLCTLLNLNLHERTCMIVAWAVTWSCSWISTVQIRLLTLRIMIFDSQVGIDVMFLWYALMRWCGNWAKHWICIVSIWCKILDFIKLRVLITFMINITLLTNLV